MKRLVKFFESQHWSDNFDFSGDDAALDDLITEFDRKHPFAFQLAHFFEASWNPWKVKKEIQKELIRAGYALREGNFPTFYLSPAALSELGKADDDWDEFVPPAPPLLNYTMRRKLDKELTSRGFGMRF